MKKVVIFIKRILYTIVNPVQRVYWFLFRPDTRGVKCVLECNGHVLFVRLGYAHKGWTIPGGGVKRGESFEEAARREVQEEVGILVENVRKIGEYKNTSQYKRDTVEVFYAAVAIPTFKVDGFEIVEAQWADQDYPAFAS
ncbi:MAG: hypothetical protein A3C06_02655 [Candidatus Taylorbacteria bacterium RIFCSPHIGHO2_02_FULL_46_13]|uniref:Nudix hydrolase domain-containing protein n=1 Tax=Candidatus Taylorbacteria bacterium RIFCSPHIGHO2_02_FULL_46_13 TaxID=1802312 RepID=A0A1G2MRT8_9BACT|nr:MAG: hypothetical protein A3C06_02655 [Candidatus Taylorbacteria bacterium RIFCSPHIGHO2_02_FULL_46_13]